MFTFNPLRSLAIPVGKMQALFIAQSRETSDMATRGSIMSQVFFIMPSAVLTLYAWMNDTSDLG